MRMSMNSKSLLLGIILLAGLIVGYRAIHPRAMAAAPDEATSKEDFNFEPYDIPDGDVEKLFGFVQDLAQEEKPAKSAEERREHQVRTMLTIVAVADKILAQEKLADDEAEKAAQLKTQGLVNLAMMGAPKGAAKAIAAVQELAKDKREILVQFAKNNEQLVRIICVGGLSEEDRDTLIADVLAEVQKRKFAQRVLNRAQMLGESLEEAGDRDRVIAYYGKLAKLMRDSEIEPLIEQAKRIEGQLRKLQLPGNFLEIAGTTLDGKKFDWDSYRGKVVLVDFWATWCGPCRAELPNVKKNYKKYHKKGFEVVGISLDDEVATLKEFLADEKISWVTLFEPDEKNRGWETPLAVKYGITGIPMAILVDKEGKVVSLSARGPELSRLLAKMLDGEE